MLPKKQQNSIGFEKTKNISLQCDLKRRKALLGSNLIKVKWPLTHIINEKGEVLSFMPPPVDVNDREPLQVKDFMKEIYGKLVGDKGYIS